MTFFTLVVENRPARSLSTARRFNSRGAKSRSESRKAICSRIHERSTALHLSGLAQLVKSYLDRCVCLIAPPLRSSRRLRASPAHCLPKTPPTLLRPFKSRSQHIHAIASVSPDRRYLGR